MHDTTVSLPLRLLEVEAEVWRLRSQTDVSATALRRVETALAAHATGGAHGLTALEGLCDALTAACTDPPAAELDALAAEGYKLDAAAADAEAAVDAARRQAAAAAEGVAREHAALLAARQLLAQETRTSDALALERLAIAEEMDGVAAQTAAGAAAFEKLTGELAAKDRALADLRQQVAQAEQRRNALFRQRDALLVSRASASREY